MVAVYDFFVMVARGVHMMADLMVAWGVRMVAVSECFISVVELLLTGGGREKSEVGGGAVVRRRRRGS
jgi:hypothetical protein